MVGKVRRLFHGYPELLQGFKVFLPHGQGSQHGMYMHTQYDMNEHGEMEVRKLKVNRLGCGVP